MTCRWHSPLNCKTMKLIQIERSGSTQTCYWPTPVQPETTLERLAVDGEIIERPDLSDCVQGRERCRVIQVKTETGVYAGTAGRFFAVVERS